MAKAEEGFQKSKADPEWNYKFRLSKAEALRWQRKNDKVEDLLRPAPPPGLTSPELAIRRNLILGTALASRIPPDEVPPLLGQAEQMAIHSSPHLLGDVALARGVLASNMADSKKAEQEFRKALALSQQYQDSFLQAEALGDLGQIFTHTERYDKAMDWDTWALEVTGSHNYRFLHAGVLLNIGWNYVALGDFDNALDAFKNMESFSSDSRLNHIANANIGEIYLSQGNYELAREYFNRAFEMAVRLGDESASGTYLNSLALAALGLGDLKATDGYNQRALKIQREQHDHENELDSLLTTAAIADARKDFKTAEPLLFRVITDTETFSPARIEAEAELARLYAASGRKMKARQQFKTVLRNIESVRGGIEGEERRLAFSFWEARFHTAYINFLVEEHDPRGALQVTELMRAHTLEEGLGGKFKRPAQLQTFSLQKFLAERRQVVMTYWLAPARSFLWVVTPAQLRLFILPGRREIDTRVKLFEDAINSAKDIELGNESGEELYRMLVQPAQALIPRQARVVVIPDGSLGQLNFETLLVPGKAPHLWVRDVELQDASSIALLMKQRLDRPAKGKLLVIGDPLEADPAYPKLRYAQDEIDAATSQFAESTVIVSAQAVPSAYVTAHPGGYDVIHFATHGVASEKFPLDSAIILSRGPDGNFKLYAREIVKTPLKARIVVISACYGAGKRTYSAQGLVGLAWAFLRAGTHQVIAGLWNVNDKSTSILMQDFYREWSKSGNAAAALRRAKLKMLNSQPPSEKVFRRPYYWASLQLYTGS